MTPLTETPVTAPTPARPTAEPADIHSCSYMCDRPGCIRAQRDELRDRIAELETDAARYRWLRDGCCDKDTAASRIAQNEYGMHWDAAIDAARKE